MLKLWVNFKYFVFLGPPTRTPRLEENLKGLNASSAPDPIRPDRDFRSTDSGVNINWQQSKSSGQQNGSIIKEL